MIKVLINGITGKMGRVAKATIGQQKDLHLAAEGNSKTDLAQLIKTHKPDVVVDLTTPDCVFANSKIIIEQGARPVIGTTGLTNEQIAELEKACKNKKLGGAIVPNFSLGAMLMMKYAQDAVKYFPDCEIIEMHHNQKKDAPSGTALKTMQVMDKDIPIHSVRLPGLFAHQLVMFGGFGELLTIRHDALNREAMMPGLYLTCRKVMELNHMVYGLENLV